MDKIGKFNLQKKQAEKKVLIGIPLLLLGGLSFVLIPQYIIIAIILLLTGFIFLGMGLTQFSKVSAQFKQEVLVDLVSTYVDQGEFSPLNGLSQGQVYSSEFVKHADRFHTEDYLSGYMDGVHFVSSDVKLEEKHVERTENGTRTYYETYFLGRMFIFEFNKDFDGYLWVLERGSPYTRRRPNKIKLESVQFNKKFKTYTTNDHSAFYVLTPHFMEKLQEFELKNKGNILFSFIDDKLYIGINNFKDTFELRMFRNIDDSTFEEFKRDLLVIRDVVQELKLNNNIFK
jgi:hypothetical protein